MAYSNPYNIIQQGKITQVPVANTAHTDGRSGDLQADLGGHWGYKVQEKASGSTCRTGKSTAHQARHYSHAHRNRGQAQNI